MSPQKASDLTPNHRLEIIKGWAEIEELEGRMQSKGIYVGGIKEEYIEETAKKFGVREETVRLVMAEGIRA